MEFGILILLTALVFLIVMPGSKKPATPAGNAGKTPAGAYQVQVKNIPSHDTVLVDIPEMASEFFQRDISIQVDGLPVFDARYSPVQRYRSALVVETLKRAIRDKQTVIVDVRANTKRPGLMAKLLIDGVDAANSVSVFHKEPEQEAPVQRPVQQVQMPESRPVQQVQRPMPAGYHVN